MIILCSLGEDGEDGGGGGVQEDIFQITSHLFGAQLSLNFVTRV